MMDEVDHYAVLGLSDDEADEDQIKKAFRKLAKESHPDKNPGISPHVYRRVQRARDVLLDPKLREAHKISRRHKMKKRGEGVSQGRVNKEKDKRPGPGTFFKSKDAPSKGAAGNWRSEYANKFAQDAKDKKETPNFAENSQSNANQFSSGPERPEAKAKKETPNFGDNARSNQYSCPASSRGAEDSKKYPNFAGDAEKKKYNFFSTRNAKDKKETPVGSGAEPMDTDENLPHEKPFEGHAPASYGTGAGQSTRGANRTTNEPHIQEVFLTLEMVATGCIKDMYFTRPRKLEDGTMGKEELLLSFEVKPGWKAGSKVTFGKAIQTWKNAEKDIVFVMRDAVHPIFTRDGSNLLYTAHVTAAQVELGSPMIGIPTLGGGKKMLVIEPDYVDHPELRKTIKGEGLPFPKEPTKKGDLIVKFVSAS